jgi:hypothetical protein
MLCGGGILGETKGEGEGHVCGVKKCFYRVNSEDEQLHSPPLPLPLSLGVEL